MGKKSSWKVHIVIYNIYIYVDTTSKRSLRQTAFAPRSPEREYNIMIVLHVRRATCPVRYGFRVFFSFLLLETTAQRQ